MAGIITPITHSSRCPRRCSQVTPPSGPHWPVGLPREGGKLSGGGFDFVEDWVSTGLFMTLFQKASYPTRTHLKSTSKRALLGARRRRLFGNLRPNLGWEIGSSWFTCPLPGAGLLRCLGKYASLLANHAPCFHPDTPSSRMLPT